MRRPRALRRGDRIALVAPASAFAREEFDAGLIELRRRGFEPVFEPSVFARHHYTAGDAATRAAAFRRAWTDPSIAALMAVRGGYGSMQILPLLDRSEIRATPKPFIGYSDNTSLLTYLTTGCGLVAFHGPMIEGRVARGDAGYDFATFSRTLMQAEPAGPVTHSTLETIRPGEAAGLLLGGTLTQLVSSLGTPFAFDPPRGHILFVDEVAERPYRIDRMLTQLRQAGLLSRASGIVFGELPRCDEPGGAGPLVRTIVADVLADFSGPILFGLPSGHTDGVCLTLPLGVRARVVAGSSPELVIEEAAVTNA
jgi:muramoyltetrapeptide carboxypeptidase